MNLLLSWITPPPLDCDLVTHRHGCGECDGCRWWHGYSTLVLYVSACGLVAGLVSIPAVAFDWGPYPFSKAVTLIVAVTLTLVLSVFALFGWRGTVLFAPPRTGAGDQ
ncbi:hypothetical protein [Nocardia wallacei]|uniref:hypothetical protein n=1 Tax=Nocardia wallacei TaxID=480035 RepID=UPI0024550B97|nr:hypothetical protein [Nocardia wallacei]